jgi:hypothetical protein
MHRNSVRTRTVGALQVRTQPTDKTLDTGSMHRDHDRMKFVLVATVAAVCVACGTKRNEERCLEGLCSDPDLPFCDVDGTIGGEPNVQQCRYELRPRRLPVRL